MKMRRFKLMKMKKTLNQSKLLNVSLVNEVMNVSLVNLIESQVEKRVLRKGNRNWSVRNLQVNLDVQQGLIDILL